MTVRGASSSQHQANDDQALRIQVGQFEHCDNVARSSSLVSTVLENGGSKARLKFPKEYLDPLGFEDGGKRKAISFSIRLDNFGPYDESKRQEAKQRERFRQGYRDSASIVVRMILPDHVASALRATAANRVKIGDDSAIKTYNKLQENGLLSAGQTSALNKDFFIAKNNKMDVTDVFMCSPNRSGRTPNCDHTFMMGSMIINIVYARRNIDDWGAIRTNVAKMLKCFNSLP